MDGNDLKELKQRIESGQTRTNQLVELLSRVTPSPKTVELQQKAIRMLTRLGELRDEYISNLSDHADSEKILAELSELKQMLAPKEAPVSLSTTNIAELTREEISDDEKFVRLVEQGVERVAAKRKAQMEETHKLWSREEIITRIEEAHQFRGRFGASAKKQFLNKIKKFLDFAPPDYRLWDRTLVLTWKNKMEDEGWSGSQQNQYFQAMKACFDAVNQSFPKVQRPKIDEAKQTKPPIEIERVKTIIRAAKEGKLTNQEVAYVALWSAYGLRRMEIAQVLKEHIKYSEHRIHLIPEKGQKARQTLERDAYLPDAIIAYLQAFAFPSSENEIPTAHKMSKLYRRVEEKLNLPHVSKMGWHAMRRTLNTYLKYRIGKEKTLVFMRWAKGREMTDVYEVAMPGVMTPVDIDREILEGPHHPFMEEWKK